MSRCMQRHATIASIGPTATEADQEHFEPARKGSPTCIWRRLDRQTLRLCWRFSLRFKIGASFCRHRTTGILQCWEVSKSTYIHTRISEANNTLYCMNKPDDLDWTIRHHSRALSERWLAWQIHNMPANAQLMATPVKRNRTSKESWSPSLSDCWTVALELYRKCQLFDSLFTPNRHEPVGRQQCLQATKGCRCFVQSTRAHLCMH